MSGVFNVGLLWSGDAETRPTATLESSRLANVAKALHNVGITVEPVVYSDESIDETREQLLRVDGVLVWVNPIEQGRDRTRLNGLLRQVANSGKLVSAHPEVIDKIGTKEVLYRTRHLGWGSDTRLYATWDALHDQLPTCLAEGHPRVLKHSRGNGGTGVWKVEVASDTVLGGPVEPDVIVRVRHAARGSNEQHMTLGEFITRCRPYFANGDSMVDQIFQPLLTEGMIRCYLVRDRVVGFGEQLINALYPAPPGMAPRDAPQPGPRHYYPPSRSDLQTLKMKLETEWLSALCASQSLDPDALPVIWDADFLHGPRTPNGEPVYVLCEINVSSVFPFPDDGLEPLARETLRRLKQMPSAHGSSLDPGGNR